MSARDEMARRVAELEAAAARARAVHQKHDDSEHCRHDGESWPCPTIVALTEGGESR